MNMKFSMESDALTVLNQKTVTESDDLGTLVRQLVDAAEPLEHTFNGVAKAKFNQFKERTDDVGARLNNALVGITGSIAGQNKAFTVGAEEGVEAFASAEGSATFDTADATPFSPKA